MTRRRQGVVRCSSLLGAASLALACRVGGGAKAESVTLPDASAPPQPVTHSTNVARAIGASSPEDAWRELCAAMRDGRPVEPFATRAGIDSLEAQVRGEPRATAFARWGAGWGSPQWEVRWRSRESDRAEAFAGPEAKEHGLSFVRTPEGWKLDRWLPGQ
jgi:hypothetical protein